jgi:hypothetical protein
VGLRVAPVATWGDRLIRFLRRGLLEAAWAAYLAPSRMVKKPQIFPTNRQGSQEVDNLYVADCVFSLMVIFVSWW